MSWGGEELMGNHEPMITLDEHRRILNIINDHNLDASRRRIYDFLLRGFVFCGICGKRFVGEKRKKKILIITIVQLQPEYTAMMVKMLKPKNLRKRLQISLRAFSSPNHSLIWLLRKLRDITLLGWEM